MKIENWAFVYVGNDPYQAPEVSGQKVQGEIYNHGGYSDGEKITTSNVINKGRGYVQTQNSSYELGKANPEYLKAYPEAAKYQGS